MQYSLAVLLALLNVAQISHATQESEISAKEHDALGTKFSSQKGASLHELIQRKDSPSNVPLSKIHKANAKLQFRRNLVKGTRADGSFNHEVVFAVKQNNLGELKAILNDVSNPRSANFGKHLSKAEVTAMTHNVESHQHVVTFLQAHGARITKNEHNSDYITAEAPIRLWESLFSAEFHEYSHVKTGRSVVRTEAYSLPESLVDHVTAAFNTVQFPDERVLGVPRKPHARKPKKDLVRKHVAARPESVIFDGYVTPDFLNEYFSITSNTGNSLGSQCVYESINQTYSPSDLTIFQETFGTAVESVAVTIGGHSDNNACAANDGNDCGEANLDLQYIMAVSQVTPTTYYYWNGTDFILDFVTAVANMADPPKVISISYSGYEAAYDSSYFDSFETEAMKLGVLGVTLLSASGDDGVAGFAVRGEPQWCDYYPQFPATSPYVTAVGGTQGPETGSTEIACQSNHGGVITTGGGFSDYFDAPDWQTSFITHYFSVASHAVSGYSTTGRGYPDVSSLAANYLVIMNGTTQVLYGTSASTPVIAGFVALVNAARLAAGKSTLGWINPSLYAYYSEFVNDITSGKNNCVADADPCCSQGFSAASGWDPLTGLGSVNYPGFYDAMFALGDNPNEPTALPTAGFTMPSFLPTVKPTHQPTTPTVKPSKGPTVSPTRSIAPVGPVAPTRTPTQRPSRIPTAVPTDSENYIMAVTQGLNGITATQFQSDSANSEAFTAAVMDTLSGVTSVTIDGVTDAASSSATAVGLRRLTTNSINIDYSVLYNIATLGYSGDPDGAYNNLVSTLTTAVDGTAFNTYLTSESTAHDATDMDSVTTGSASSSGYTSATAGDDDDASSDKKGLSQTKKIIIGVVVGVGGCLLIVCLIAAYMMMCGRSSGGQNDAGGGRAFEAVDTEHALQITTVESKI